MSQSVTIDIPDSRYERLHEISPVMNEPVSRLLADLTSSVFAIERYPDDDDAILEIMRWYNLDQLTQAVNQRIPVNEDERIDELTARSKERPLSEAEEEEVEKLMDKWAKWMMVHTIALIVLKERGHDVSRYSYRASR